MAALQDRFCLPLSLYRVWSSGALRTPTTSALMIIVYCGLVAKALVGDSEDINSPPSCAAERAWASVRVSVSPFVQ